MIRLILKALNAPALVALAMLGVAIQTSLFAPSPLSYFQPDVVLIAIVWCALKRGFTEGGILTLVLGNVAEVHSSVPQGVFLVAYMAVFLSIRVSARVVVIPNLTALVMMTMAASLLWKLGTLGVLYLLGVGQGQWRHTLLFLSPGAVINGALGLWAYRALERFDWVTFKSAHAQHFLEDEYILESEGV